MSEEKKIAINFGLISFEILSYSFEKPPKDFKQEKIGYQIQFLPDVDLKEGFFSIEMKVDTKIAEDSDAILGSIHTMTKYGLSEMESLINNDGNFVLPKNLAVTFLSIALSTTRGALAAKSEGNLLSQFVMPLVNPEEMYESSPLKGEIDIGTNKHLL